MKEKIFISTAIPYVNAKPHIGFALELVEADVLARFYRNQENEVFFLTGTDENSLKNVQAAEKSGEEVSSFVKKHADVFEDLTKKLNISNDDFIRTSEDKRHIEGSKDLWKLTEKDIYKKDYSGLYCVGCEEFVREADLVDGECAEHPGQKLEEIHEENYFFALSRYEKEIKDLIEGGKLKIIPETKKNEVLNFIKTGLQDFSISRSKERAKNWGIEVPEDSSQIMYVWFDALGNYVNGYGKDNWEKADKRIHVIGKGINRFHSVYWIGMLLSAGLKIPDEILIHGYITAQGQKISKSLGNTVDPFELIDKYGVEAVRYYLLREIPSLGDGDFSEEKFVARYNGDLANGLGNFASRVLTLAEKYNAFDYEGEDIDVSSKIEEFKLNEALSDIWSFIQEGDKYINDEKPWESGSVEVISKAVGKLYGIAKAIDIFLPETSKNILEAIENKKALEKPLFPRI